MRRILWPGLVLALTLLQVGEVTLSVTAQAPPLRLYLPALSRGLPVFPGVALSMTSSRLTPQLKLAVSAVNRFPDLRYDVLLSADGGRNWAPVAAQPWHALSAPPGTFWIERLFVRIIELEGQTALVVSPAWADPPLFYLSLDLGHTWSERPLPAAPLCDRVTAGAPVTSAAAPSRLLYTVVCETATAQDAGLFETEDGGATWTTLNALTSAVPDWYGDLLASTQNPGLLYRRELGGWERTWDAAHTWERMSIPGDHVWLSPSDDLTLAATPSDGLAGLTSQDGGAGWRGWSQWPCVANSTYVRGPVWLRGASATLVAACADGSLIRSRDGGQSWDTLALPIGGAVFVLAGDDAQAAALFVQSGSQSASPKYRLYRSTDAGDTWQDVLLFDGT